MSALFKTFTGSPLHTDTDTILVNNLLVCTTTGCGNIWSPQDVRKCCDDAVGQSSGCRSVEANECQKCVAAAIKKNVSESDLNDCSLCCDHNTSNTITSCQCRYWWNNAYDEYDIIKRQRSRFNSLYVKPCLVNIQTTIHEDMVVGAQLNGSPYWSATVNRFHNWCEVRGRVPKAVLWNEWEVMFDAPPRGSCGGGSAIENHPTDLCDEWEWDSIRRPIKPV